MHSGAADALGRCLSPDHPPAARRAAAGLLKELGPEARPARAALEAAAIDEDAEVRDLAGQAVKRLR